MPLIMWNKDIEIGVEIVDKQHNMLIDMINEFHDAILAGQSYEKMGDIITGPLYYSQTHFAAEEELFWKYGYPYRQAHVREHNDFIVKISSKFDKLKNGELVLSVDISRFLRDWLLNHVMVSDKKFLPYVKDVEVI